MLARPALTRSYTNNSFTSCEADAAYPPGIFPLTNGSTSTFAQRYTGTYTGDGGSIGTFTVGQTVTPQTPFSTPASSMCTTYSSVGNGIALSSLGVSGTIATIAGSGATGAVAATGSASMSGSMSGMSGSMSSGTARMSGSGSQSAGQSGQSAGAGSSASTTPNAASALNIAFGPAMAGVISVGAILAGVGAVMI